MGELVTRWLRISVFFVVFWALAILWNMLGCRKVQGNEMAPTFDSDKYVKILHNKFAPEDLVQDDLVVYEYQGPTATTQVVARVIALPGERVAIKAGQVLVNDRPISQGQVGDTNKLVEDAAEIVVPRDHVYVLCDNRKAYRGSDSRGLGPIWKWAIIGKVWQ